MTRSAEERAEENARLGHERRRRILNRLLKDISFENVFQDWKAMKEAWQACVIPEQLLKFVKLYSSIFWKMVNEMTRKLDEASETKILNNDLMQDNEQ